MNAAQMPDDPTGSQTLVRPSHWLKSPTTLTRSAFGAHTAKCSPATPSMVTACDPSFS